MTTYRVSIAGDPTSNGDYVGTSSPYVLDSDHRIEITPGAPGTGVCVLINGSTVLYSCPGDDPTAEEGWGTTEDGIDPPPHVSIVTAVEPIYIVSGAGDTSFNGEYRADATLAGDTGAPPQSAYTKYPETYADDGSGSTPYAHVMYAPDGHNWIFAYGNASDGLGWGAIANPYTHNISNPTIGEWFVTGGATAPAPVVTLPQGATLNTLQRALYDNQSQLTAIRSTLAAIVSALNTLTARPAPLTTNQTGIAVRTELVIGTGKFNLPYDNLLRVIINGWSSGNDINTKIFGNADTRLGNDGAGNGLVMIDPSTLPSLSIVGSRTTTGNPLTLNSRQLDVLHTAIRAGDNAATAQPTNGTATETYHIAGQVPSSANVVSIAYVTYTNGQQSGRVVKIKEPFPV